MPQPGRSARHDARIGVVVVVEYPELAETIRRWLQSTADLRVIDYAFTAREGLEVIRKRLPDVVVMAAHLPGMDGLQATKLLSGEAARVILLAEDDSKEMLQAAMQAGARECLHKPPPPTELIAAIRRVAHLPDDRPPPVLPQGESVGGDGSARHLVAVCGLKGGVGRSMLAANLATMMAEYAGRVALVDANIEGGVQQTLFNIDRPKGLEALCTPDLDYNLIHDVGTRYQDQLTIFCSPQEIEAAARFTPEATRGILVELREHFDLTIVDVAASLNDATATTLESADRLLIVTTLEFSAIQQLQKLLEVLRHRLNIAREHCLVIANRVDGAYGIKPAHVERSLGIRIVASLPDDPRTVNAAINHGMPFVVNQRRAPITRLIQELGRRLHLDLEQGASAHRGSQSAAPPRRPAQVSARS